MHSLKNLLKQWINIKVFVRNSYLSFALFNPKKAGWGQSDPTSVVFLKLCLLDRESEALLFFDF